MNKYLSLLDDRPNYLIGCVIQKRSTNSLSIFLDKGRASPDEFPWNCLMLTNKNRFIGACAIVPDTRNNDVSRGTSTVITAAHKLNSLKGSE